MTKKNKTILIAQPLLLGHSYDASLIKNRYQAKENNEVGIKTHLTSYPYVRFSVHHEAQVIIPETRKEPVANNLARAPKLVSVDQVGSYLVVSSTTPLHKEYSWEPVLETDGTPVIIDGEPVYKFKIEVSNQLIQFIPANAHIWGVLDLCTADRL